MERVQPENITDLNQAREIIRKLQSDRDKAYKDLNKARAIVYDLTYGRNPEPVDTDLKAEIVRLNIELKDSVEKRQELKEKLFRIKNI